MLSFYELQIKTNDRMLINNLSLTLLPSAIIYLTGANGTGKTSLLKTIAGIQMPAKGNIKFGKNQIDMRNIERPFCSYIGHNLGLKSELTIWDNIRFWPEFYRSSNLLAATIHYFELEELLDKKTYELSAGNQKKVAISRLMACQSNIWLLDEIESNLDEHNKKKLLHLIISKANNGGIIIMSTHDRMSIDSSIILNIQDYL